MSSQCSGICWPVVDSVRGAVDTEKRLWGMLPGGFKMTREGVENVSIEDVDGDGPLAGVRPNAGGGGTADDWEVLSVIGERRVLHIDPTTDSVCEGVIVRADMGTGLIGGEGRKRGGDTVVGGRGLSNG
jgi:hypothetical protein